MPVIGFTGALGSGCSYLAHGLAKNHNYFYCSLSDPIHTVAKTKKLPETTANLQNIGDDLRQRYGNDILVWIVLSETAQQLQPPGHPKRPTGIVIDGIRNVGELKTLQQFPNFYLFSVQAETSKRQERLIGAGKKFATAEEFETADARDRDEQTAHGQQVAECNYRADIIIINEKDVAPTAQNPHMDYIRDVIYEKYIKLIEKVAKGQRPNERSARAEEALMTAAYVESKRSSCLKRKVGAVITSAAGEIITAGHNDVPADSKHCLEDPRYGMCARDAVQENIGRDMKHCPRCGKAIKIRVTCRKCGEKLKQFAKNCPRCKSQLETDYLCLKCQVHVFRDFLPGGGSDKTGKLLDICRALHAEENAILNLAKFGVRLPAADQAGNGNVLYSTTFPCNLCANKIVAVGIRKIVYAEPYTMEEARQILEQKGVKLERFQGVKSSAFFRLYP